jgi:hypothetical protein
LFEFTVNEGEGSVMEEGKEDALLEGVPEVRMVTKPSPEFMGVSFSFFKKMNVRFDALK